jgi:predicted ATPase
MHNLNRFFLSLFSLRLSFHELCDNPLGAEDYAKLSATYHTVFVEDIPQMDISMANLARRFITLVGIA